MDERLQHITTLQHTATHIATYTATRTATHTASHIVETWHSYG